MPSARVLAALLLPARVGPAHTRGYRPAHPKLVSTVPDLSTPGARRLECLSTGRRTQPVLQSTHSRRPLTHAPSWSPTMLQPVLPIHPVSSFTHSPGPFLTRSLRAPSLTLSCLLPHTHPCLLLPQALVPAPSLSSSPLPPPSHTPPSHLRTHMHSHYLLCHTGTPVPPHPLTPARLPRTASLPNARAHSFRILH